MVVGVAVGGWWTERTGSNPAPEPTAGVRDPIGQQLALARSREAQGDFAGAARAYRDAESARPDPSVRLRLAFALLRAGQPAAAAQAAGSVHTAEPDNADALLMLGLAQRALAMPAATDTLVRFLQLAPNHPAAAEVRALIGC